MCERFAAWLHHLRESRAGTGKGLALMSKTVSKTVAKTTVKTTVNETRKEPHRTMRRETASATLSQLSVKAEAAKISATSRVAMCGRRATNNAPSSATTEVRAMDLRKSASKTGRATCRLNTTSLLSVAQTLIRISKKKSITREFPIRWSKPSTSALFKTRERPLADAVLVAVVVASARAAVRLSAVAVAVRDLSQARRANRTHCKHQWASSAVMRSTVKATVAAGRAAEIGVAGVVEVVAVVGVVVDLAAAAVEAEVVAGANVAGHTLQLQVTLGGSTHSSHFDADTTLSCHSNGIE